MWPEDREGLIAAQHRLAAAEPSPRGWARDDPVVGACWVCFPRGLRGPGRRGDPAWVAAVAMRAGRVVDRQVLEGSAGAPYEPGLLALRLGPLMERVTQALAVRPDVLLLDATGRDHPRRAGLARHLGSVLDLPTVGVTHRPLVATGDMPEDARGATSPLHIGDELVACWLRTRAGTRPLVVHPGWLLDLDTAVDLVMAWSVRRTPEPLRRARQLAREARGARG